MFDDHEPDRLPGAGADGEDLNMSVEPKSELELLREQAQACRNQLLAMGSPDGQPAIIQANIRHKREQLYQMMARIEELEKDERL